MFGYEFHEILSIAGLIIHFQAPFYIVDHKSHHISLYPHIFWLYHYVPITLDHIKAPFYTHHVATISP